MALIDETLHEQLNKAMNVLPKDILNHSYRVKQFVSYFVEQDSTIDFLLDNNVDPDFLIEASYYHDIGKVSVNVEGEYYYDSESTKDLARHTAKGVEILDSILGKGYDSFEEGFNKVLGDVILSHHEHVDGSGVPKNLTMDNIPTEAKIVSVINAFDNLLFVDKDDFQTIKMSLKEAFDELVSKTGSDFDKTIVDLFISNETVLNDLVSSLADDSRQNMEALNYGISLEFKEIRDVSANQLSNYIFSYKIKDKMLGSFTKSELFEFLEDPVLMKKTELIVFESLCQFIHKENLRGHTLPMIYLSFDYEVVEQDDFFSTLRALITKYDMVVNQFCICVPKGEVIFDSKVLASLSNNIHSLNQLFGLSDFDLNLAVMINPDYHIDEIIIDGKLPSKVVRNQELFTNVQNVIKNAKTMGANIIFDGVTSEKIFDALFYAKAKCAAGPYLSRTLSKKELSEALGGSGGIL